MRNSYTFAVVVSIILLSFSPSNRFYLPIVSTAVKFGFFLINWIWKLHRNDSTYIANIIFDINGVIDIVFYYCRLAANTFRSSKFYIGTKFSIFLLVVVSHDNRGPIDGAFIVGRLARN